MMYTGGSASSSPGACLPLPLRVAPKSTHGARSRTVWPRMGKTDASSTPPRKRAPRPAHTTSASTGVLVYAPRRTYVRV